MSLLRDISALIFGAGIGQILTLATLPVITRLYSPEMFGIFALVFAASSTVSVATTGRFELSLGLPETEDEARTGLFLCTVLAATGAVVFGTCIAFAIQPQVEAVAETATSWLVMLVCALIFATSMSRTLQFWALRETQASLIARSRVVQALAAVAVQIGIGYFWPEYLGLLIGVLFGQMAALVYLLPRRSLREMTVKEIRSRALYRYCRTHRKFIFFSMPAALVNTIATEGRIFLVSFYFPAHVVGWFGLAVRAVGAPAQLIGQAINQGFHGHLSEAIREARKDLLRVAVVSLAITTAFATPVAILVYLYAEPLFILIFGEQWKVAGQYASLFALALVFRTAAISIGSGLSIIDKQQYTLLWQTAYCIASLTPFALAEYIGGMQQVIFLYVIISIFMHCLIISIVIIMVRVAQGNSESSLSRNSPTPPR